MPPRKARFRSRVAALLAGAALLAPLAGGARAQGLAGIPLIRDTEIEEILHRECDPIFEAAGVPNTKIYLVGDKTLNAFTPGGANVFINTGLLQETESPNEIQGVVAHETGHVAGGHIARVGELQKAGMVPMILTMGLGILAAAAGAPDAGAAIMSSSQMMGELGALGYSRETEGRADQAALGFLERAGYSGRGLVDFFDNFRYQEVFDEARRFPFFQSHPISSERIELLRRRVEEQKHYNTTDSAEAIAEHAIMKAKLAAFMDSPTQTFIKYKENDRSFPARYARAIAYYRANETERALGLIDGLLVDNVKNPYLWELKGQVLFEAGRAKEAEEPFQRATELKPNAPLLQILFARALLANDNGKIDQAKVAAAVEHLRAALRVENDNADGWRLIGQAYDMQGQDGQARLAAAEERFSLGDMAQARIFALRARQKLTPNTPEWRRATDIVLVANPTDDDLKALGRENGLAETASR
jgi:predicted Zn-dependent protease